MIYIPGQTSLSATVYTSVRRVYEYVNYFTEVYAEAIGTGDAATVTFNLANRKVVAGSDTVRLAGVVTTAYTINEDLGTITFTVAPGAAVAITGDYWYSDLFPSSVADDILRAEDEVNRRIGRSFGTSTTVTEFYDGNSAGITNWFSYQPSRFVDDVYQYVPNQFDVVKDKYLQIQHYPVLSVNLVAINERLDQRYNEDNQDANLTFGSTRWVSQSFTAGYTKSLVRIALYLRYNTGTAAVINVQLRSDAAGVPSATVLGSTTITALATTATTYQWYNAIFTTPVALTAGTRYHIIVQSATASATTTYHWGVDGSAPTFANESVATSADSGGAWVAVAGQDAVFNTYIADDLAFNADYRVDYDTGRIVLVSGTQATSTTTNATSGAATGALKFVQGIQNVVVNYSYGYATVPRVVEDLTTKIAAIYFIQRKLLGSPSPLGVPQGNVDQLRKDVEFVFKSLGEKAEMRII